MTYPQLAKQTILLTFSDWWIRFERMRTFPLLWRLNSSGSSNSNHTSCDELCSDFIFHGFWEQVSFIVVSIGAARSTVEIWWCITYCTFVHNFHRFSGCECVHSSGRQTILWYILLTAAMLSDKATFDGNKAHKESWVHFYQHGGKISRDSSDASAFTREGNLMFIVLMKARFSHLILEYFMHINIKWTNSSLFFVSTM